MSNKTIELSAQYRILSEIIDFFPPDSKHKAAIFIKKNMSEIIKKLEQKEAITDIMNEDSKNGLYEIKNENKKSPVEKLWEDLSGFLPINKSKHILESAKKYEKEHRLEELIDYQIHLNDLGNITNHDWDYEKEAKSYLFEKM
jgi:hypothetical protein